jgi:hypothetical protein
MKIWICVESLSPLRWAIRYGNKWRIVKNFISKIDLRPKDGKIAPQAYLEGFGRVKFKKNNAVILKLIFFFCLAGLTGELHGASTETCGVEVNSAWIPLGDSFPDGEWELVLTDLNMPVTCGPHVEGKNGHRVIFLWKRREAGA